MSLTQDAPEKVVVVVPPPRLELGQVVVVVPPHPSTRALKKDPVLRGP